MKLQRSQSVGQYVLKLKVSLAVILFALALTIASSPAAQLHIGTAETSITPDRPVALEGSFRLRFSDGVESPVTAGVVILESREGEEMLERSVMVSADLVHLPIDPPEVP